MVLAGAELSGEEVTLDLAPRVASEHPRRSVVVGLPQIGTDAEHHLFATLELNGTEVTQAAVTGWNQQQRMQPSHISKQRRSLAVEDVVWTEAGGLELTLTATLHTPEQLGQASVRETFVVRLALEPGARGDLPGLRSTHAIPPWRRSDRPLQGSILIGTATGHAERVVGDSEPERRAIGQAAYAGWQVAPQTGAWTVGGDAPTTVALEDGGLRIAVDLPTTRTDAGEGGSIARRLNPVPSMAGVTAIRVRWRCDISKPVAWDIQLFQRGQGWYRSPALIVQRAGSHVIDIPLRMFAQDGGFDMDHWFNADELERIGIGIRNGEGLGPVSIVIESIGLVPGAPSARDAVVRVDVSTLWGHNGSSQVADGLFGAHTVWVPNDEGVIEQQPDLGVRSLRPIAYGGYHDGPADRNEIRALVPMFDDGIAYVESLTGGPLMSPAPWLTNPNGFAGEMERWRAFGVALARQQQNDELPFQTVEIWNEPFMWARFLNRPGMASDPRQHGYLPGPHLSDGYARLAVAMIDAHREAGGTIRFGGPSSAHFDADGWRHLTEHVMPVVLAAHGRLDYVTEHHYQDRAMRVAAAYEAFQALHVHATGDRLPIINTEANDLVDQPGRWVQEDEDFHPAGVDRRRFVYQVADILAQVRYHNDHVVGRHIHALWRGRFGKRGETFAFAWFRPFAGDLVATHSSHPDCWALATRQEDEGAVALYNDGDQQLRVTLSLSGGSLVAAQKVWLDPDRGLVSEGDDNLVADADGDVLVTLPAMSAVMVRLSDLPTAAEHLDRRVHYLSDDSKGGLWWLEPGDELVLTSAVARPDWLRVTVAGALDGHLEAVFRSVDGADSAEVVVPITGLSRAPETLVELPLPVGVDGRQVVIRAGVDTGRALVVAAALIEEQLIPLTGPAGAP